MPTPANNPFPPDYAERVYAGVLGKIIGVYLGRPIEGWSHERILEEIGEVDRYVHEQLVLPLVVADDDISGTFTFLRALEDHGYDPNLTSAQIGETWLNYIVENRTILWWGGMGTSTEHTAFLRLKHGIPAPQSGSIELNGKTVAEQIGAQIFIEGWALINPGDPAAAADFARRAAGVSHDGEAIYGAQIVAALTAQAFVETDIDRMLDTALTFIPPDSTIATMIAAIRYWRRQGLDWRAAFQNLKSEYGYDKFGGGCHMVPNHGIVILALIYGERDFSKSLMIANTCGWDTDCNSANVGCILGVMNGLAGIDAGYDWRGPVQDRMFLPTADGGRCVTDAVQETHAILRAARALRGLPCQPSKNGARFSFDFPGSVQGFSGQGIQIGNKAGGLELTLIDEMGMASTPTFPSAEERSAGGYGLVACPTLYPGQTLRAEVSTGDAAVTLGLGVSARNRGCRIYRPADAAQTATLELKVPADLGYPITEVSLHVGGQPGDRVILDSLTWHGPPEATLGKTSKEAWVNAASEFYVSGESLRLIQNEGTGMAIHGCREWTDLSVEALIAVHLVENAGIAVRVQGLRRYYALRITRQAQAQLIKVDGSVNVLAETPFPWTFDDKILFRVSAQGPNLTASLNGKPILQAQDDTPFKEGAIALILTEGQIEADWVRIGSAR